MEIHAFLLIEDCVIIYVAMVTLRGVIIVTSPDSVRNRGGTVRKTKYRWTRS